MGIDIITLALVLLIGVPVVVGCWFGVLFVRQAVRALRSIHRR